MQLTPVSLRRPPEPDNRAESDAQAIHNIEVEGVQGINWKDHHQRELEFPEEAAQKRGEAAKRAEENNSM